MPTNPPAGVQMITVRIAYEDPVQAVAFLERAFGFLELIEKRLDGPNEQLFWGDRRYEAKDHEGDLWFFHEHTRDVPREEIEEIEAGFRQS